MAMNKTEALVPAEEQPYTVPENWHWVYANAFFEIEYGKGLTTKDLTEFGYPVFGANGLIGYYSEYMFEEPQALMSCRGAYSGTMNISMSKSYITSNSLIIYCTKTQIDPYFIYYLFLSQDTKKLVSGSAQPQVTIQAFRSFPIPLPPVSEQQRIVDRIESLFAKLDEAKEKAQAVVDGFENRKAAILHQVFTGELTQAWRKQNCCQKFRKTVTIKKICSALSYGTASKSSKEGKVAVIRMGNLQGGEIDWNNLVYSNDEEDNKKYALAVGDVLFNRTNSAEHVGKTAIYRGERPAIYAGYLIKLNYDHSIMNGEYLNYLLNSPEAREYCKRVKTDAVNQSNINAQKIGAFEIPLIGMDEQEEICHLAKKMIGAEETIRDAAKNSIQQIDTMKKAILARAFRGELGTNDPTEPPVDISIL